MNVYTATATANKPRTATVAAFGVCIAATIVLTVRTLRLALAGPFVRPYQSSQYWVNYNDGFVRRGLPGSVLTLFGGPTVSSVEVFAAITAVLAIFAMAAAAVRLFAVAHSRAAGVAAAVIVLASPFTVSLTVRDLGRYDAIGMIALVAIALVSDIGGPRLLKSAAIAALVTVSVACEEFLLVFAGPVAVAALVHIWGKDRARLFVVASVGLLPAAILATASVAAKPTVPYILNAIADARVAGVDLDVASLNAISALIQTPAQTLGLVAQLSVFTRVVCIFAWGVTLLASGFAVWWLVGRPISGLLRVAAVIIGVGALALSFVGIDYGRWWALAFVAVVAILVVVTQDAYRPRPLNATPVAMAALIGVLGLSVVMQGFPVHPKWDPGSKQLVQIVDDEGLVVVNDRD